MNAAGERPRTSSPFAWSLAPPSGVSQHCLEPLATCSCQGQGEPDVTPYL